MPASVSRIPGSVPGLLSGICLWESGSGTRFVPSSCFPLSALLHQYRLINLYITDGTGSLRASLNKTLGITPDIVIEVSLNIQVTIKEIDTFNVMYYQNH